MWGCFKMKVIRIKAKRAFTPTKIPGASYVINQYIGCQHACAYCYAKFMNKFYPYGKWGSWVVVKENLPELVKKERIKGIVYMSSVSDPYQPIERELKLTRKILENMDKKIKLSILTKSNLVLRDIDLFKKFENIEVGLTINDFNGDLKKIIEPYATANKFRIEALKVLRENKIKNYAFISPIIPGLIDLKNLIEETKDFVDSYWFEFLNIRASGSNFIHWLRENYPKSYEILIDESRFERYLNQVKTIIKGSGVQTRGLVIHYKNSLNFSK